MFNINDYLKKFSKIDGDSKITKEIVYKALKEVSGVIEIDFEIKKGIIYIKSTSIIKSIVFMKKDKILSKISNDLTVGKIIDIR